MSLILCIIGFFFLFVMLDGMYFLDNLFLNKLILKIVILYFFSLMVFMKEVLIYKIKFNDMINEI